MVGASANSARPSFLVLKYLSERGYRMLPINPGIAGGEIHGLKVYASLADAPGPIDMVEIFRNSEAAGALVDEALALDPLPKVIWMQLGVRNDSGGGAGRGKGRERRDEPLPEDRIRPAFRRDRLARRQLAHNLRAQDDQGRRVPAPDDRAAAESLCRFCRFIDFDAEFAYISRDRDLDQSSGPTRSAKTRARVVR